MGSEMCIRDRPNSGDLNPIETAWAELRKDLAEREFEDLKTGKVISKTAFKQRVSQLFYRRTRTTALLFREIGERHAKKIGKMPIKQIWALWQIIGSSQYSAFRLLLQHRIHRG